jgi:hypothetical protein
MTPAIALLAIISLVVAGILASPMLTQWLECHSGEQSADLPALDRHRAQAASGSHPGLPS